MFRAESSLGCCIAAACALHAPRVPIVFPGLGPRSCGTPLARLASCTVRFRAYPSPKDLPLGLSSMPCSPVPDAVLPLHWTFRFHSPKADFQMRLAFALLITIPIVSTHSKVSDVFEISRVRTEG